MAANVLRETVMYLILSRNWEITICTTFQVKKEKPSAINLSAEEHPDCKYQILSPKKSKAKLFLEHRNFCNALYWSCKTTMNSGANVFKAPVLQHQVLVEYTVRKKQHKTGTKISAIGKPTCAIKSHHPLKLNSLYSWVLWTELYPTPRCLCWTPNSQCDVTWRWDLWDII